MRPSTLFIKELKKVVNFIAKGLEEMDVVKCNTCSNTEACLDKRDDTFETRLENKKRVKDVREGKK